MDSLYETDLLMQEGPSAGEKDDVVDPYKVTLSEKASQNNVTCKDRISIMELHTVDKQVDQYSHTTSSDEEHKSTVMDLYSTDVDVNLAHEKEDSKENVDAISQLYDVDQSIRDMKWNSVRVEISNLIQELYKCDLTVDGSHPSSATTSSEEMSEQKTILKSMLVQNKKDHHIPAKILDLLQTDLDIDAAKAQKELSKIEELLNVDKEIDIYKMNEQKYEELDECMDLYDTDCQVMEMEYHMPVKGLEEPYRSSIKSLDIDLTEHSIENIMDKLYAIDMQMDIIHEVRDMKSDIDAIIDLYTVDEMVDNRKETPHLCIMRDLYVIDATVDGSKSTYSLSDFVDPVAKDVMRQYQARASMQIEIYSRGTLEVAELLRTDLMVDGYEQSQDIAAVSALLAVDEEVTNNAKLDDRRHDLDDIYELYDMDMMIAGAGQTQQQEYEYTIPVKGLELDSPPRKNLSNIDLTEHSIENIMDKLYAIDIQMDTIHEVRDMKSDIDAIMDLYDVDVMVDKREENRILSVIKDLCSVDALVDCTGSISSVKDFVDPVAKDVMRQYQTRAAAERHMNSTGSLEIAELLRTDMMVDSNVHKNDINAVSALLDVDNEIQDKIARTVQHDDLDDIYELYDMDMEIAGLDQTLEYSMPVKGLDDAPNSPIRMEKIGIDIDATLTGQENVFDQIYANDLWTEKHTETKEEAADVKSIIELYHVDCEIAKLQGHIIIHPILKDLWEVDKSVDKANLLRLNDFTDPFTTSIVQDKAVHLSNKVFESDLRNVMELIQVDGLVDNCKWKEDIGLVQELFGTDLEIEAQMRKSREKENVDSMTALFHLDKQVEKAFMTLLKNDQQVDKNEALRDFVDPVKCTDTKGNNLIGSLFDVEDLLTTDAEVEFVKTELSQRSARSESVSSDPRHKPLRKVSDGSELIGQLFGMDNVDNLLEIKAENVSEGDKDAKKNASESTGIFSYLKEKRNKFISRYKS
ncbi:predicted protein [Chaetoceros tenuissimus]|uniref:Uncharacterized protein n=1 Tax=Chaetoceros tenuissimus TaxID=426638 RepID=A0AAD3H720_9STRA|nr:predicted protein [Chaetoceros tenuissimus]